MVNYQDDSEWWEDTIRAVNERSDYWETTDQHGLVFFILKKHTITPAIGDTIRYYGSGAPNAIRGVALNGNMCFYESPDEFAERTRYVVHDSVPLTREMDTNFGDYAIQSVDDIGSYWRIIDQYNTSYNLPKDFGVQPVAGDTIRYYGGGVVYGVDINGKKVFYEPLGDEGDEPKEWKSPEGK